MTYWLPKLLDAGLPVPKTIMVQMFEKEAEDIWRAFDGERPTNVSKPFFSRLRAATDRLGYPCFLRTGHTSAKHDWGNTCFLSDPAKLRAHVVSIIEYGELSSPFGLPHEWWAAREYLPIEPIGVCPRWSGMPVCKEFRVFVRGEKVECWHPYWPINALEQGGVVTPDVVYAKLAECSDELEFTVLASKAGGACGGYWSVDVLETARGWYITDMAEGEKSFHWENCANKVSA